MKRLCFSKLNTSFILLCLIILCITACGKVQETSVLSENSEATVAIEDLSSAPTIDEPAVVSGEDTADDQGRIISTEEVLLFGNFEQDGNNANGDEPIEWIPVYETGDSFILVSRYCIESRPYQDNNNQTAWADSSLAAWLNNDFLSDAFSAQEQRMLLSRQSFGKSEEMEDVFGAVTILSAQEASLCFPSEPARIGECTAYAESRGIYVNQTKGGSPWFLRTPAMGSGIMYVRSEGDIDSNGTTANDSEIGIRPVICISKAAMGSLQEKKPVSLDAAQVRDWVTFGSYEQDNNASNGKEPIEWVVLERKDDALCLISRYCLDSQPFHDRQENVSWKESSLRKWLMEDFANTAFSEAELKKIVPKNLKNSGNKTKGVRSSSDTQDRVYLFSADIADHIFGSNGSRAAKATEYAMSRGIYVNSENGFSSWWLRTPGKNEQYAEYVSPFGVVDEGIDGDEVTVRENGVRPVIWVQIHGNAPEPEKIEEKTPVSEAGVPAAEPAGSNMVTWTLTKSNTGTFDEKKTITYTRDWEEGTVHTVVCNWEPTYGAYMLIDYDVDFDAHTINIVMDKFEGDYGYTELIIDTARRICTPSAPMDSTGEWSGVALERLLNLDSVRSRIVEHYMDYYNPRGQYACFEIDDYPEDPPIMRFVLRYQVSEEEAREYEENTGMMYDMPNKFVTYVYVNLETGYVYDELGDEDWYL